MYRPKRNLGESNDGRRDKDNKRVVRNPSAFSVKAVQKGKVTKDSENEFDLTKILHENWDLDDEDLTAALGAVGESSEELLLKHVTFSTPRRQLEQLEYQSNQLNQINTRVTEVLHNFEEQCQKDDVIHLYEAENDVGTFDWKSLMEESKGKVKVLVVDYNKLCLTRDNVLSSLREWFDVVNNDSNISEDQIDEDRALEVPFTQLVRGVHKTKDNLVGLHSRLVEYCQGQIKQSVQHLEEEEARKQENEQLHELVGRLQLQVEDLTDKSRESEMRMASVQKMLERKNDELKFFRITDSSKTGQIKDEMFQLQQKTKEHEAELLGDLDKANKKFHKSQENMDQLVLDLHTLKQTYKETEAELMALRSEHAVLREKFDKLESESTNTINVLYADLQAYDSIKAKEINMAKAHAEEELIVKSIKLKNEYEAALQRVRDENAGLLKSVEAQHHDAIERQANLFVDSLKSSNTKGAAETLKKVYDEHIARLTENHENEKSALKREHARVMLENTRELQMKLNAQAQVIEAQRAALANDYQDKLATEKKNLAQGITTSSLNEKEVQQKDDIKNDYERQLTQYKVMLVEKEKIIDQLRAQLSIITNALEKVRTQMSTQPQLQKTARLPYEVDQQRTRAVPPRSGQTVSATPTSTFTSIPTNTTDFQPTSAMAKATKQPKPQLGTTAVITSNDSRQLLVESLNSKIPQASPRSNFEIFSPNEHPTLGGEQSGVKLPPVQDGTLDTPPYIFDAKGMVIPILGRQLSNKDGLQVNLDVSKPQDIQRIVDDAFIKVGQVASMPADTNISEYISNMRRDMQSLEQENDSLKSKLTEFIIAGQLSNQNLLSLTKSASTGSTRLIGILGEVPAVASPKGTPASNAPVISSLQERISALVLENEMLRKGETPTVTTPISIEISHVGDLEVMIKSREHKLLETVKSLHTVHSKTKLLEDQLATVTQLFEASEANRQELVAMVSALDVREPLTTPHVTSDEGTRQDENATSQERAILHKQLSELEGQLVEEAKAASESAAEMREHFRKEYDQQQQQHDELAQALTENYEKRIKGLTEALTACLNDADIAEELRKDAEYKVLTNKMLNDREISRLRDTMKRMSEEHAQTLKALEKRDKQELMRMKNTLERLQGEFETFIHEELTSREQTERARSESGYYSVMSTARLTDRSSRSSTARSFAGEPTDGHPSNAAPVPPERAGTASGKQKPSSLETGIIGYGFSGGSPGSPTLSSVTSGVISKEPLNRSKSRHESVSSVAHSISSLQDGEDPTSPEDVHHIIDSEINAVSHMYQGFRRAIKHRNQIARSAVRQRVSEQQQLKKEVFALKRTLLDANVKILAKDRQTAALRAQILEKKHAEEVEKNIVEYTATIEDQDQIIRALRNTHQHQQQALLDMKTKSGLIESSMLKLHSAVKAKDETIDTLSSKVELLSAEIEELRQHIAQLLAGTHTQPSPQQVSSANGTGFPYTFGAMPGSFQVPQYAPGLRIRQLSAPYKSKPPQPTLTLSTKESLVAEPISRHDRANLIMMEQVLTQMDDTNLREDVKAEREAALSMLKTDRKIREAKVGALFKKLHEKLQLRDIQNELQGMAGGVPSSPPNDRLAQALHQMEMRHEKALARWESRRLDLIEKRKQHLLQVMKAFSSIVTQTHKHPGIGMWGDSTIIDTAGKSLFLGKYPTPEIPIHLRNLRDIIQNHKVHSPKGKEEEDTVLRRGVVVSDAPQQTRPIMKLRKPAPLNAKIVVGDGQVDMILRSGSPLGAGGLPVAVQGVRVKQYEKERHPPAHEKYIPFLNYYSTYNESHIGNGGNLNTHTPTQQGPGDGQASPSPLERSVLPPISPKPSTIDT